MILFLFRDAKLDYQLSMANAQFGFDRDSVDPYLYQASSGVVYNLD